MQCARCGTVFDGGVCPSCGTPAAAPPPAAGAPAPPPPSPSAPAFQCSRCGAVFRGTYCPVCGYPSWAAWIPPPAAPPAPAAYPLLSILWLASLITFVAVLAIAVAGLAGSVPEFAQGIASLRHGTSPNGGFENGTASWAFTAGSPAANGSAVPADGNPGGYAGITLGGAAGQTVRGSWTTSFPADGRANYSAPFLAILELDYTVQETASNLHNVTLVAYLGMAPGTPAPSTAVWSVTLNATGQWTPARTADPSTGETADYIDVSPQMSAVGTYYLTVAAVAVNDPGAPSPVPSTLVGFDNVRVRFATYAYVDFVLILPVPVFLYATQEPTFFAVWAGVLVAAALASLAVLVLRDSKRAWAAIRTPLERLPAKMRSRSALVALMQTFFAITFVNMVIALSTPTPEPSFFSAIPGWYYLYVLFNATVYEEVIFRVLMIGLPLLIGSLVSRVSDLTKGQVPRGTSAGRYVLGSFRYLYGGGMSRRTSLMVLLPAALLLVASAAVFGLAHAPGYGDWKVLPAALAGLALGYLYLRHGLAVSILFHFSTNMFVAASILVTPDEGLSALLGLLYLVVAAVGSGFFAYYFVYVVRLVRDIRAQWRGESGSPRPAAAPAGPAPPPAYPQAPPPPANPGGPGPTAGPPPGMPGPPIPTDYVPTSRPPVYGMPPVRYRCPRCGWVEATYESGRFRCARCGYVS